MAIFGCNQAGKSTLLGVVTQGEEDNGKGRSRLRLVPTFIRFLQITFSLLRHRHEILSGRTSSIAHEIIGFTPTGELINYQTTGITNWFILPHVN